MKKIIYMMGILLFLLPIIGCSDDNEDEIIGNAPNSTLIKYHISTHGDTLTGEEQILSLYLIPYKIGNVDERTMYIKYIDCMCNYDIPDQETNQKRNYFLTSTGEKKGEYLTFQDSWITIDENHKRIQLKLQPNNSGTMRYIVIGGVSLASPDILSGEIYGTIFQKSL